MEGVLLIFSTGAGEKVICVIQKSHWQKINLFFDEDFESDDVFDDLIRYSLFNYLQDDIFSIPFTELEKLSEKQLRALQKELQRYEIKTEVDEDYSLEIHWELPFKRNPKEIDGKFTIVYRNFRKISYQLVGSNNKGRKQIKKVFGGSFSEKKRRIREQYMSRMGTPEKGSFEEKFHTIISRNDIEIVRSLLLKKLDPTFGKNFGVIICCVSGRLEILKLLVEGGADPRCHGDLPLWTAQENYHDLTINYLKSLGATLEED